MGHGSTQELNEACHVVGPLRGLGRQAPDAAFEVGDDGARDVHFVDLAQRVDAAGGEGVELEDLAAGQVHADEGEAVGQKLGPQEVADALLGGAEGRTVALEAEILDLSK